MDATTTAPASAHKRKVKHRVTKLSPRELEVLQLASKGFRSAGAGAHLGISERTVEQHLHTIRRKLEVGTTIEAACRAVREGLI